MESNFVNITRRYGGRSKWADIARQIAAGNDGFITVGDEIKFQLKNGVDVVVQAVAVDAYAKNSVVFAFKDYPERYVMNDEATNRGGWEACKMRRYMNGEFLELLPDDLKSVIKLRTIKQKLGDRVVTTQDMLWAMSRKEIFGQDWETDIDDVQFEWFKDRHNRIKFHNGDPAYWWERSPYYNIDYYFCFVGTGGSANYYSAYYSYGVAPAFMV